MGEGNSTSFIISRKMGCDIEELILSTLRKLEPEMRNWMYDHYMDINAWRIVEFSSHIASRLFHLPANLRGDDDDWEEAYVTLKYDNNMERNLVNSFICDYWDRLSSDYFHIRKVDNK